MHVSAGQEAFELHSKDTVNDATYLLLSSLSVEALRKANIIKALAMNLHLARPDKDPGSFVSTKSADLLAVNLHLVRPNKDPGSFVSAKSAWLCFFLLCTCPWHVHIRTLAHL